MHPFYKSFILLLAASQNLFSADLDKNGLTPELSTLNNLIEITKKNVEIQENIRSQLIDYQKINKEFLKNPDDKELLFEMIKSADLLLKGIKEAHLTQNFSLEFLKELTLFSQIASKRGVPKP